VRLLPFGEGFAALHCVHTKARYSAQPRIATASATRITIVE
jgi:hypothetical protein